MNTTLKNLSFPLTKMSFLAANLLILLPLTANAAEIAEESSNANSKKSSALISIDSKQHYNSRPLKPVDLTPAISKDVQAFPSNDGSAFSNAWTKGLSKESIKFSSQKSKSNNRFDKKSSVNTSSFFTIPQKAKSSKFTKVKDSEGGNNISFDKGASKNAKKSTKYHVIGTDDRREVTEVDYWSEFRSGQVIMGDVEGLCSGSLVSPTHVLTSAHCVTNQITGEITDQSIYFAPGRVKDKDLIGYYYAKRVFVPKQYTKFVNEDGRKTATLLETTLDIAVLELDQAVDSDDIGFYEVAMGPKNTRLTSFGYPGDKPLFSRWLTTCETKSPDSYQGFIYENTCDSIGGQSGSGMTIEESGEDYLVGVLSSGSAQASNQTRLKNGNFLLWRNYTSNQSFNWREAGNLDFIHSWIHWDNLSSLLPSGWSRNQKSEMISAIKELSVSYTLSRPVKKSLVSVNNQCGGKVDVAIAIRKNGSIQPQGFYTEIAYQDNLKAFTEDSQSFYYWASRNNGSEWSGDYTFELYNYDVNMRKKRFKNSKYAFSSPFSRYNTNLTCN